MRGAPQAGIFSADAADEVANLAWDGRTPRLAPPNLPRPEEVKCVAVPRNNCFRLHEDQRRTPTWPHAGQPNPQESVGCVQLRPFLRGASKHAKLMAECNILQLKRSAVFRTDEAAARKSASHPEIESRTLPIRCNFHDLSHFAFCERDSSNDKAHAFSAARGSEARMCSGLSCRR